MTVTTNEANGQPSGPNRVIYITAGAGGMFCGSCLNDNTLVRSLQKLGVDVELVPTYTPITTDEQDVSIDQVFFGGINVYLQQKVPLLRRLPSFFDRFLNNAKLIRWATKNDVQADPNMLGEMTVSMLKGMAGFQKKEMRHLLDYLTSTKPHIINFTNALIAGCTREIKQALNCPIVVTLQGDDIFLDYIPEQYAWQAIEQIRQLSEIVDAYVVHSNYYAYYMSDRLGIPRSKFHVIKLGIDPNDFAVRSKSKDNGDKKQVGYLARLSPEKGFHVLCDAFIRLRKNRDDVELQVAGWLGTEHRKYADEQFKRLKDEGLEDAYTYHGTVDRQGKVDFLQSIDVFTVPTTYREPKGRFALEAMACGVPLVLPNHGAFPEMIAETNAGVLVNPNDPAHLAEELHKLVDDADQRRAFGQAGRESVLSHRNGESMARQTLELYQSLLEKHHDTTKP